MAASPTASAAARRRTRLGVTAAVGAYLWWGALPLYFPLLKPAGALEIIGHRIVWSLVFCLLLVALTRGWRQLGAVLRDRRTVGILAAAAVLVGTNWTVYVYGVLSDHVVDASLGYFINPLVTVILAVLVLGERLRPAQWVALGAGAAAVLVIAVGYGQVPWIALALAVSFGLYGLAKNRVGRSVPPLAGLTVETAVLTPVALVYLFWWQARGSGTFTDSPWHALLLAAAGIVTAVPLLLFGASAARLPLSVLGLIQYLTPVIQFVLGVTVFGEQMPPARWWGFALVWVALIVLGVDGLRAGRSAGRARRVEGAASDALQAQGEPLRD